MSLYEFEYLLIISFKNILLEFDVASEAITLV
jgi:hypothetical protein